MTSQERGSRQNQHNHRLLRGFVASQTSLPMQWAHGQQRTRGAEPFARHTSRTSVQATLAPWEPMGVPWWRARAVMSAAQNIQRISAGGARSQPSKLARRTAREANADGAQLLAWITVVNRQLGINIRLQKQSRCGSQADLVCMLVPREAHWPDNRQPPE